MVTLGPGATANTCTRPLASTTFNVPTRTKDFSMCERGNILAPSPGRPCSIKVVDRVHAGEIPAHFAKGGVNGDRVRLVNVRKRNFGDVLSEIPSAGDLAKRLSLLCGKYSLLAPKNSLFRCVGNFGVNG